MNNRHQTLLALALATALVSPAAWAEKGGKGVDPTTGSPVSGAVRSEGPATQADTAGTTGKTVSQTAREANPATQDAQVVTSNDASTDIDATTGIAGTTGKTVSQAAREANAATQDTQDVTSNDASSGIDASTGTDASTGKDTSKQTPPQRGVHERMVRNPTNTAQTDLEAAKPIPPTQSQGAAHATDHASVTQRALWGRLDTDGDGQISASESAVDAEFNAGFQSMDTNDDGLVTDAEYQVVARSDIGSGQGQGGVNAASHSTAAVGDLVDRLDTDRDGSISATEAQADAGFNTRFSAADANSDGMVSSQEYQAWAKAQRK